MAFGELKVYIQSRPWEDGIDLYFVEEREDGRRAVAKPLQFEMELKEEMEMIGEPTLRLSGRWGNQILKAFADALQREGIKPASDAEMKGKFEATQYHLEDMRKLLDLKRDENTKVD